MEKINEERRERILRIFRNLFRSSLDKIENVNKKKLYEDDRDIHEVLIEEVCKPQFSDEGQSIETDRSSGNRVNSSNKRIVSMRNSDKICYLLKNIVGFQRFMKFNQITDENVMKAAQFFQYEKVPQYNYIFRQGETPKSFYIILRGSISIRKRKFKTTEELSEEVNKGQKPKEDLKSGDANSPKIQPTKKPVEEKIEFKKNNNNNNNLSSTEATKKLISSSLKSENQFNTIVNSPLMNSSNFNNDLIGTISDFNIDNNNNNNNVCKNNNNLNGLRRKTSKQIKNSPVISFRRAASQMQFSTLYNSSSKDQQPAANNKLENFKLEEEANEILEESKSIEEDENEEEFNVSNNKPNNIINKKNENNQNENNNLNQENKISKNNLNQKNPVTQNSNKNITDTAYKFDWTLLFKDSMHLDLELHNMKNKDANNINRREKGKLSKAKNSKTDLQNLLLRSKTLLSQANLASNSSNSYRKIISSDSNSYKIFKEFEMEDELIKLSDGQVFGEWGLMFNMPRAASAFAMEETHLLYLDKEFFRFCFHKNMHRSISEKKNFFIRRLPFLRGSSKVEEFLKNLNPMYFNHGEIIYTERNEAKNIYLIFQGEGLLQKFIHQRKQNYLTIQEITENKDKLKTILKVDRGGVVGLESLAGEKFYKNNFISYGYTVVFKIPFEIFSYKDSFIVKNFIELYKKQQTILDAIYAGLASLYENTDFKREKPEGFSTNYERKLIEKGASQKNVNLILEEIKKQKKKYENDLDCNYLYGKKIEEDFFEKQKLQQQFISNNNDNNIYNSAEEDYSPLEKFKKIKRRPKNINLNNDNYTEISYKLKHQEDPSPLKKLQNRSDNEADKKTVYKSKAKKVKFSNEEIQSNKNLNQNLNNNFNNNKDKNNNSRNLNCINKTNTNSESETIDYDERCSAIAKKASLFSNIDLKTSLNKSIKQEQQLNSENPKLQKIEEAKNQNNNKSLNAIEKTNNLEKEIYAKKIDVQEFKINLNLHLDKIDFSKKADKNLQITNKLNDYIVHKSEKTLSIFQKSESEILNNLKKKDKEKKNKERGNKHKIKTRQDLLMEKDEIETKRLFDKKLKEKGMPTFDSENKNKINENKNKKIDFVNNANKEGKMDDCKNEDKKSKSKDKDLEQNKKEINLNNQSEKAVDNSHLNENTIKEKNNLKRNQNTKKHKSEKNLIIINRLEQINKQIMAIKKRSNSKLNMDLSIKKEDYIINKNVLIADKETVSNQQNKNNNNKINEAALVKIGEAEETLKADSSNVIILKRNYTSVNLVKINLENLETEKENENFNELDDLKNNNKNENNEICNNNNLKDHLMPKNNDKDTMKNQSFEFDERKEFEKHKSIIYNNKENKKSSTSNKKLISKNKKSQQKLLKIEKTKSDKNLKLISDHKSNNNSYENHINSPNNSNLKTNKNSNFTKIIYDFISPNYIFKEKSAEYEKSVSGNSTNNLIFNSIKTDLSSLRGNSQQNELLQKKISLPMKSNFINADSANTGKTDKSPVLNKFNGICEKNIIESLRINENEKDFGYNNNYLKKRNFNELNSNWINDNKYSNNNNNNNNNNLNIANEVGYYKETLNRLNTAKLESKNNQLILNDKFVNLTSNADMIFINYNNEGTKINKTNTDQETEEIIYRTQSAKNTNGIYCLKNNLLQKKLQLEKNKDSDYLNKIKQNQQAENKNEYNNLDFVTNNENNFNYEDKNLKKSKLISNLNNTKQQQMQNNFFITNANLFKTTNNQQHLFFSSSSLKNNLNENLNFVHFTKERKSNTASKSRTLQNHNYKTALGFDNQLEAAQKQMLIKNPFLISNEKINECDNKPKQNLNLDFNYNNRNKIINNNNFNNENLNIYAKQKLELINSLIERDIEKLPELRENILDFQEHREIMHNPNCFQEEIDKVKILLENNKKEYTTNYKAFNQSGNLFYKRVKKSQKTFITNENSKQAEKPLFKLSSAKMHNKYSTCNNSALELEPKENNKSSSNLLQSKNLNAEAILNLQLPSSSKNFNSKNYEAKKNEKNYGISKSRSDKHFLSSAQPLLSSKIKIENEAVFKNAKYLKEFMRNTHKEFKSYLGKDFIKFSKSSKRKNNEAEELQDYKLRKIANVFQSEFEPQAQVNNNNYQKNGNEDGNNNFNINDVFVFNNFSSKIKNAETVTNFCSSDLALNKNSIRDNYLINNNKNNDKAAINKNELVNNTFNGQSENLERFITNENNFSSQYNSNSNVLNYNHLSNNENQFSFSQTNNFFNKTSNKNINVMVSCRMSEKGNSTGASLKNVQSLSKIMNQWVAPSAQKVSDFNTGTFSLPLLCDAGNKNRNKK